jgi:hypothetical protein
LLGITVQSTEKNTKTVIGLRREKVVAFKRGLESQQNSFRKQSSALQANYHVAHLLARGSKHFPVGNL